MMTPVKCTLIEGDLYVFSNDRTQGRLWGLFGEQDDSGRILLEVATTDFCHFDMKVFVPAQYDKVEPASRAELRDFAYNMGVLRV